MDVVHQFLGELGNKPDKQTINKLLSLDIAKNPWILLLNSVNEVISNQQLDKSVTTFDEEWLAFNELVSSFIKFANQLNPWSILQSFDLYTSYLNDLSIAFTNSNRGSLLSDLTRELIEIIIPLANKLDYQLFYQEHCNRPRLTYLASILLKIFNNIRSQINDGTQRDKRSIILFVSNKLCLIYFKLSNPLLCRNVFANMNNANLQFNSFQLIEQVQYRYFLGKFYLIKDQLIDSFSHFSWCLQQCSINNIKNITMILQLLLPISLVIGKNPNFSYIKSLFPSNNLPNFINIYENLFKNLKIGNFNQYFTIINQNQDYLKQLNVLLLLTNKSKVLIIRNLIRKLWILQGKPTVLNYDSIALILKISIGNDSNILIDSFDDLIIQNLVINLIDQNLIRGKIIPKSRSVVLSKTDTFNKIDAIYYSKFSYHHADKWMNE